MSKAWRLAAACLLVGSLAIIALYYQGFASVVAIWSTTVAYRFLFLVPVLFLYFIWLRRPDLSASTPRPGALGLVYGAVFGVLWLFAEATQLSIGGQVAAVGMLQAVFLTVLGWRVCERILFPLLLLWLMVPFGDLLTPALIEMTTALTIGGLQLAGLPAAADGNLLLAGGARYAIIQECTGLDFLLGNFLVSLVFANLIFRRTGKRVTYVLAGLVVAIAANILRTVSVILITAAGFDLASDHETYGWVLFLLAMLLQMGIGLRFRDSPDLAGVATPGAAEIPDAPGGELSPAARLIVAVCGILMVAALAPAYSGIALRQDPMAETIQLCIPPEVLSSSAASDGTGDWRPEFPTATTHLHRLLRANGRPVDLFVGYYWRQVPGSKLIAWGNRFHDGKAWKYMASGTETAELAGVPLSLATERLAGTGGARRLVWYWYWVDGRLTSRPWQVKLLQARAVLFGGDQRAAVIALSASDEPREDTDATRAVLKAALNELAFVPAMLNDAAGEVPGRVCPRS